MTLHAIQEKLRKSIRKAEDDVYAYLINYKKDIVKYPHRIEILVMLHKIKNSIDDLVYEDIKIHKNLLPMIEIVNHGIQINGVEILDDCDEQKYKIIERKEEIITLIGYVAEANKSDTELIMEDIEMLMSYDDEWILSDLGTNSYILPSEERDIFIEECKKLVALYTLKKEGTLEYLDDEEL